MVDIIYILFGSLEKRKFFFLSRYIFNALFLHLSLVIVLNHKNISIFVLSLFFPFFKCQCENGNRRGCRAAFSRSSSGSNPSAKPIPHSPFQPNSWRVRHFFLTTTKSMTCVNNGTSQYNGNSLHGIKILEPAQFSLIPPQPANLGTPPSPPPKSLALHPGRPLLRPVATSSIVLVTRPWGNDNELPQEGVRKFIF